jgi:hypothetical protein
VAPSETERDLQRLEAELKRLEAEYNMFFAGRLPRPPWETRSRVEAIVKQYDRTYIRNTGERFRFETLQSRFAAFVELWDRGLRARDEGGPGPKPPAVERIPASERQSNNQVLRVSSFRDPVREMDKLQELYNSVAEARRQVGEEHVPFHRFAELVKGQVKKLNASGRGEVAFRVSVKDGKVSFTAKTIRNKEKDRE